MILGLCLGLAAVLVHGLPDRPMTVKPRRLGEVFSRVGSWVTGEVLDFDGAVVEVLQLDDYTHRTYTRGSDTVWVYIGYYLTGNSIGASHSPLVCYPGQGWRISDKQELTLDAGGKRLRLMSLVAAKGGHEDLVLYWFQAYDRNAPDTFRQKIQAMWARATTGRSDSAFVRISIPVEQGRRDEARRTALAFAGEFYPLFLSYVTGDETNRPG
jgi:EpsI family protein